MDNYVSISSWDNWGYVMYMIEGTVPSVSFEGTVRIMWPDGYLEKVLIEERRSWAKISDMGHSNDVEQLRYGFSAETHGVPSWVEITSVKVHKDDINIGKRS